MHLLLYKVFDMAEINTVNITHKRFKKQKFA